MFAFFKKKRKENKTSNSISNNDTFSIVKQLLINIDNDISPERIKEEAALEDLGFDSIKFLNLLLALEDILNRDLDDIIVNIDLGKILKVRDIIEFVDNYKLK